MSNTMRWRERFVAAGIHLVLTAAVAALAGALIFFVWFPGALADMAGGRKLFFLITGIDVALGPLISLVIYNRAKSRGKLIFDYTVISALQLAALIYGTSMIAISRPVFVVFAVDRLEVVAALELDAKDLEQATLTEYRKLPWLGPKLATVELPHAAEEKNALLFSALGGKDVHMFPKYYRPYQTATAQILQRSIDLATLRTRNADAARLIEAQMLESKLDERHVRLLPVNSRFGFWSALIDARSGEPLQYLAVDLDPAR